MMETNESYCNTLEEYFSAREVNHLLFSIFSLKQLSNHENKEEESKGKVFLLSDITNQIIRVYFILLPHRIPTEYYKNMDQQINEHTGQKVYVCFFLFSFKITNC